MRLDLHIHSERSPDGRMSLKEIVTQARAVGLDGVAVCDHDRVLSDPPECSDFLLIPGVEVSTGLGHLLGLFVTQPVDTHDFREAAERIHAQGGIAVLAHPFEHSADAGRIASAAPLLDGVEVWNSRAERKIHGANALAEAFAREYGLIRFGGSDAHLPEEIGNGVTTVPADRLDLSTVKAALLRGETAVSGCLSPARYTALSQLTKRRKSNASAASYVKWALFAAKCCVQDLLRKGDYSHVADR